MLPLVYLGESKKEKVRQGGEVNQQDVIMHHYWQLGLNPAGKSGRYYRIHVRITLPEVNKTQYIYLFILD